MFHASERQSPSKVEHVDAQARFIRGYAFLIGLSVEI